jgi:N-acetylneuraminate synthase
MEFSESQWAGLKEHAEAKGLLFLSSPFSCEAIDLLSRIGVCGWKVASGEVSTPGILDRMAATGLPILMSSGMSTWAELDVVVFTLRERQAPFALLQCTTRYPCPPEEIGLNVMAEMSRRYGCPSGLSDHSGTIFGGLAARMMGASLIEVHVTLSRRMFGPDVTASVTIEELRQLVDGLQFIDRALMSQCDKDYQSAALEPTRRLFTKSVVLASDLKAGASLTRDHFAFKKPGTGIPAAEWLRLVGRRVCRDLPRNHVLQEDDLHPEGAE